MSPGLFLSSFLVLATALVVQLPPDSDQPAAQEDAAGEVLDYQDDPGMRMTVPVHIGGSGPYQFLVDTGSERTVIAADLAEKLRLSTGRSAELHSMTEVSRTRTVIIPSLEVGGRNIEGIHAPALDGRHLGARGILGVDTLQSHRVSFDFVRRQMVVTPSQKKEMRWPSDVIVVTARRRFGHLVLVDADVDGQKVWVIVDTGAEMTVGNSALRRKLERKKRLGPTRPVDMVSVTGGRMTADLAVVNRIRIGGIQINDMQIGFADVHPFRKLDLMDRPAILLGIDALRSFDRVSVDFPNRKVRLLLPKGGRAEAPVAGTTAAASPASRVRGPGI